jgi:hypothetical protein
VIKRLAVEHGWPPSHIDLLLRANLAEESTARAAWQAWRTTRVLEDAEWRELRLLAPLARRVRVLDPGSGAASSTGGHGQVALDADPAHPDGNRACP